MYGDRPLADALRYAKARATNLFATVAPDLYFRYTGETGRGRDPATAAETAAYFARCADEQDARLCGVEGPEAFWADKVVLEYGPGDCPGLALEMLGRGARNVFCVDRFPLARPKPYSARVLEKQLENMPPKRRERAAAAFASLGAPESGFDPARLRYLVKADGLSDLRGVVDVAVSRAVLEHANDLSSSYVDMARALAAGGLALHLVDLKSHGLHRSNPLDFLTWPDKAWTRMYGAKGAPNRHRVNVHRDAARAAGLREVGIDVVERADPADVAAVRPKLDARFKTLPSDDLEVLGFWISGRR